MTTVQEKRGSVQERQNQKILDFATLLYYLRYFAD